MEAFAVRRLEAAAAPDNVPIGAREYPILLLDTLEQDAAMGDALRGELVASRDGAVVVDVRQTGLGQRRPERGTRDAVGIRSDSAKDTTSGLGAQLGRSL